MLCRLLVQLRSSENCRFVLLLNCVRTLLLMLMGGVNVFGVTATAPAAVLVPGSANSDAIADSCGRRPPLRFSTFPKWKLLTRFDDSWPVKPPMNALVHAGVWSSFRAAPGFRISTTSGDE